MAEATSMDVDKQELDEEHADAPAAGQKRTKTHNTTEKPSYFDTTPVEGKRQRKTVEVFKPDEPRRKGDTSKPQEGAGERLGDIPNVKFKIGKVKSDDDLLMGLHRLLFGRPGKSHERRRNLYTFSGLVYSGDKDAERSKVQEKLNSWKTTALQQLLDVFDLPRPSEGTKEHKVQRVLEFLEKPHKASDKDLAAVEEKKKAAAARKRAKASPAAKAGTKRKASAAAGKAGSAKKAKGAGGLAKQPAHEGESEGEEHSEEEEEQEEGEEEEEASEEEEENVAAKKGSKKRTVAAKSVGRKRKQKAVDEEEEEEEEEEEQEEQEEAAQEEEEEGDDASEKTQKKAPASAAKGKGAAAPAGKGRGRGKQREVEEVEEEAHEGPTADKEQKKHRNEGGLPSDAELQREFVALLQGADMQQVTFKQVMTQLEEKLQVNLKSKKKWLKSVLEEWAIEHPIPAEAEEPAAEGGEKGEDEDAAAAGEPVALADAGEQAQPAAEEEEQEDQDAKEQQEGEEEQEGGDGAHAAAEQQGQEASKAEEPAAVEQPAAAETQQQEEPAVPDQPQAEPKVEEQQLPAEPAKAPAPQPAETAEQHGPAAAEADVVEAEAAEAEAPVDGSDGAKDAQGTVPDPAAE